MNGVLRHYQVSYALTDDKLMEDRREQVDAQWNSGEEDREHGGSTRSATVDFSDENFSDMTDVYNSSFITSDSVNAASAYLPTTITVPKHATFAEVTLLANSL